MNMNVQLALLQGSQPAKADKSPLPESGHLPSENFDQALAEVAATAKALAESGNPESLKQAALSEALPEDIKMAPRQAEWQSLIATAMENSTDPEGLAPMDLQALAEALPRDSSILNELAQAAQKEASALGAPVSPADMRAVQGSASQLTTAAAESTAPLARPQVPESPADMLARQATTEGSRNTAPLNPAPPQPQGNAGNNTAVETAAFTNKGSFSSAGDLFSMSTQHMSTQHMSAQQMESKQALVNPVPTGGGEQQSSHLFSGLQNSAMATGLNAGTSSSSPASSLSAPIASQQWQQDLGQQVASLGRRGGQSISLNLNPAELGPLMVDVKVSEQLAQVQFLSGHAQVRAAVEQAIPQLREALAEQGITLGETSVGEQRRDGQDSSTNEGQASLTGEPLAEAAGELSETKDLDTQALEATGRVNLYI